MTIDSVLSWLAEASIVLTLVVLLILIVRHLARGRVGAGWTYALWLALPASLAATLAPAGLFGLPGTAAPWLPALDFAPPPLDFNLDGAGAAAARSGPTLPSLAALLLAAWLVGLAAFLARHLAAQLLFERAIAAQARLPRAEELLAVEMAAAGVPLVGACDFRIVGVFDSPVACGVFRPRVLLPEDFFTGYSFDERRVMTLHEAEHVRGGHVGHRLVARLLRDLFWFHPLAWIAERAFIADQELACDQAALLRDRSIRPKTYAETLLKAASLAGLGASRAPAATAPLTRARDLRERTSMLTKHAALGRTRAAGALVLAAVASVSVLAACAVTSEAEPAATAAPTMGVISQDVGTSLNEAIEALNNKDYAGARDAVGELDLDSLTPYERSRTEQILFQIDYASQNYDAARAHLEQAIDAGGLSEEDSSNLRYQIAQSFMVEERWPEGAQALEEWFRTAAEPNPAAYYLLAVAYYQQQDYGRALPHAEQAVALSEQPQASWMQLVIALYMQEERWRDAMPVLERLLAVDPSRRAYWEQLAAVYGELGMTAERDALLARAPSESGPSAGAQDDFAARQPLVRINPVYPNTDRSGDCLVSFNLTDNGTTTDVNAACSDPVFETAAETAVQRWRYAALADDDSGLPRTGVTTELFFQRSNE